MNWIALTLIGWFAAAILHGVTRRIFPRLNSLILFCGVGFAVGLLLLGAIAGEYGMWASPTIASAVLFTFLCELHVFTFTFVISSISVWLLISRLDGGAGATVVATELSTDAGAMVEERTERMRQSGLIETSAGNFSLTGKGRLLVWVFRRCRGFFGHDVVPPVSPGSKLT